MASERASVFQVTQLGVEAVLGQEVPADKLILSGGITPSPAGFPTPYRTMGSKVPITVIRTKERMEGEISGVMDYSALLYWLAGYLETPTTTTPAGATNTRRHTFTPLTRAPDDAKSYTMDFGSVDRAERMTGVKINALTLTWSDEEAALSGSVFGQRMQQSVTITPAPTEIAAIPISPVEIDVYVGANTTTNETQTITIVGTPTGGDFTLTYLGAETTALTFDESAADVETALEALATIGLNNVTVAGGPGPGTPFVVTFTGVLAGIDAFLIELGDNSLTGGTSPTVTIAETTPGGLLHVGVPDRAELTLPERYIPHNTLNSSHESYSYFVEQGFEPTLALDLPHNTRAAAYMANLRAADQLFVVVQAFGPATEAGFRHRLRMTMPFFFTGADQSDNDGVWQSSFTLQGVHNTALTSWLVVELDNLIAAL